MIELSNLSPLSRVAGACRLICPICGTSFSRPYAWTKRANISCCSRACQAEARKVRVETKCVICGISMEKTPSEAPRVITCSKRCSGIRRRRKDGELNQRGLGSYQKVARRIAALGQCACCGDKHGPWVVRGLVATLVDEVPAIDESGASLWCRKCHMKEISPLGVDARKDD